MSWVQNLDQTAVRDALGFVQTLDTMSLRKYCVVGEYLRYDEDVKNDLKDLKYRIIDGLQLKTAGQENYLLWGPPGSGKSHFPRQLARSLSTQVCYVELNFARPNDKEFQENLAKLEKKLAGTDRLPLLCFMDETDSKSTLIASARVLMNPKLAESCSYETWTLWLRPITPRNFRACFILAGSHGSKIEEMKELIRSIDEKGKDLLDRIPPGNEYKIRPLNIGDKIVVFLSNLMVTARNSGLNIHQVDKLALLYITLSPRLSSARNIGDLAVDSSKGIQKTEDRFKYENLFVPNGNVAEMIEFGEKWISENLLDRYIEVVDDQDHGQVDTRCEFDQVFEPLEKVFGEGIEDNFLKEFDHSKQPDYAVLLSRDFKRLFFSFFGKQDTLLVTGREGVGKTFNLLLIGKMLEREKYLVRYSSIRNVKLARDTFSKSPDTIRENSVFILDDCQEDLEKTTEIVKESKVLLSKGAKRQKFIFLSHPLDPYYKTMVFGKEIQTLIFKERYADLEYLARLFFRKINEPERINEFLSLIYHDDPSKIFFAYRNMKFWNLYFNVIEDCHKVKIGRTEFLNCAYSFFKKRKPHLFQLIDTLGKLLPFFKNDMPVLKDYADKKLYIDKEHLEELENKGVLKREAFDWYDKNWTRSSALFIRSKIHPTEARILEIILKKFGETAIDDKTILIDYAGDNCENLYRIVTEIQFHDFDMLEDLCNDNRFALVIQKYLKDQRVRGKRLDRMVITISKLQFECRSRLIDNEVLDKWIEKLNNPDYYLNSKIFLLRAIFKVSPTLAYESYKSLDLELLVESFRKIPMDQSIGSGLPTFRKLIEVSKNIYSFYLFSTNPVYENGLNNGRLPGGLKIVFGNKKFPLSNDARVEQETDDRSIHRRWRILDGANTYLIRKTRSGSNLNVYYSSDDLQREIFLIDKTRMILDKCIEEFSARFEKHEFFSQLHWLLKNLDGMKLRQGNKGSLANYFFEKIQFQKIVDWIRLKNTAVHELRFVLKTCRSTYIELNGTKKNLYHDCLKRLLDYEDIKRIFDNPRSSLFSICLTSSKGHEFLANHFYQYSHEDSFARKVYGERNLYLLNQSIESTERNDGLSDEQRRYIIRRIIASMGSSESYIMTSVRIAKKLAKEFDIDLEMDRFLDYKEKYAAS